MTQLEQDKIKSLRNLPQYKDLSDKELQKIISKSKTKKEEEYNLDLMFSDTEQKDLAQELLKKYLKEYDIESVSDKNLLKQLIHLEIYHFKLQKKINNFSLEDGYKSYQLKDLTEALHKNLEQILKLKEKLGLLTNRKEVSSDAFKAIELLKKKFRVWLDNNQASRFLICPWCSKEILLRIKTDAWESQKFPYFKDRLLGNDHLVKLYKMGKLTKEDVALILGTSSDYTDWLIEKWKEIPQVIETKEVKKEIDIDLV
jgi:hypothetical protein